MKWKFIYYNERVKKDILSLRKELLVEFFALKETMEEAGPFIGMPFTKALGNGLFEIRLHDKDGIARIFYGTISQQNIIILSSFIKKTQKTPDQELKLARKRLKEIKQDA